MDEKYFTIKNTIILAFVLFNIYVITLWNLPGDSYISIHFLDPVRQYMHYTGLWQNWAMFSPDVISYSQHIKIVGDSKKGEIVYEPEFGYGAMRRIKYFENILNSQKYLIEPYLKHICREMKDASSVKLILKRQTTMPFGEKNPPEAQYEEMGNVTCKK